MDDEQTDAEELRREVTALQRKLDRSEHRREALQQLQTQNQRLLQALMTDLETERAETERLLLNILPEPVARQLQAGTGVIAQRHERASVLFADIVGFTPLSEVLSAEEAVAWLDGLYSEFDRLVQHHEVEKIRTIGDGYMVAAGVPHPRDDHAVALTRLALDMKAHVQQLPPVRGHKADFRIGINSGPLVAGVIGTHKFQYDLWGDTVNTASRMESHGLPGEVQVSSATHELIADAFECEPRGPISVKGKGHLDAWLVVREQR